MQRIPLTKTLCAVPRRGRVVRSYSAPRSIAVDDLCLPLSSPYALESLVPSAAAPTAAAASPSPLSRETLAKLHRLSALVAPDPADPTTESHLAGLSDLVAIVERVRTVDTSSLGRLGARRFVDARIRAEPDPIEFSNTAPRRRSSSSSSVEELEVDGETLLAGAERSEGRFFVAQMPENVRTRKVASTPLEDDEGEGSLPP
ncbi:hypothetical protein JCM11491_000296 [Sporobolomyces phaffii]